MTSDQSPQSFDEWWEAEGITCVPARRFFERDYLHSKAGWDARQAEVDAAIADAERADRLWRDTARWRSERCQRRDAVLDGMTAEKLGAIAEWMDVLDILLDKLQVPSDPAWKARLETARGAVPRDTIQKDLRAWAGLLAKVEAEDSAP